MKIAITRDVSPRIGECELSYLEREPIDAAKAAAQHAAYERRLEELGCRLVRIEPAPEHPDGVFVEDAAVVLGEVAVITRPGAPSRRGETASVARALVPFRPLMLIEEPGTLDGGDVVHVGRRLYVGRSARTNDEGIAQLRQLVAPFGYDVVPVRFEGCLHLKSAATAVDDETILMNRQWVEPFGGLSTIEIDPAEPSAANVLRIGDTLVCAASNPRTRLMLEQRGYRVVTVDVTEMEKAEGGVTCCCLSFRSE